MIGLQCCHLWSYLSLAVGDLFNIEVGVIKHHLWRSVVLSTSKTPAFGSSKRWLLDTFLLAHGSSLFSSCSLSDERLLLPDFLVWARSPPLDLLLSNLDFSSRLILHPLSRIFASSNFFSSSKSLWVSCIEIDSWIDYL